MRLLGTTGPPSNPAASGLLDRVAVDDGCGDDGSVQLEQHLMVEALVSCPPSSIEEVTAALPSFADDVDDGCVVGREQHLMVEALSSCPPSSREEVTAALPSFADDDDGCVRHPVAADVQMMDM